MPHAAGAAMRYAGGMMAHMLLLSAMSPSPPPRRDDSPMPESPLFDRLICHYAVADNPPIASRYGKGAMPQRAYAKSDAQKRRYLFVQH